MAQVLRAEMTLCQGVTPSVCTMEILPQAGLVNVFGVLAWAFGPTVAIANVSNAAIATITTQQPSGVSVGDQVWIAGVQGAVGANGLQTVSAVLDALDFQVALAGPPGAYTSGGSVTDNPVLLQFTDCKVDKASFRFNQGGLLWQFSIFDRRWFWAFGEISGDYNERTPNVQSQQSLDNLGSINPDTVQTPQQLAALLLDAMKEPVYNVSQMPDITRPEVHWQNDPPAQALASLADQLGCRVVLKLDDSVAVVQQGVGAALPATNVLAFSAVVDPPEQPDAFKVVGGKTRYNPTFLLEAVGLDIDGTIQLIDDLTYKPAGGWIATDPFFFYGVQGWGPLSDFVFAQPPLWVNYQTIAQINPQQLARQTVYRWYRISMNDVDATPVAISGVTNTPNPVITTAAPHGFQLGDPVNIQGVKGAAGVNTQFLVALVVSPTAFAVALATPPGAWTSGGTACLTPLIPGWDSDPQLLAVVGVSNTPTPVITTATPHGYSAGDQIHITGIQGAAVNGGWAVASILDPFNFSINPLSPGIAIANVTNAVNAQVTTRVQHGLNVGQPITISGVQGATGINGSQTVATIVDDFTFIVILGAPPGNYIDGGMIMWLTPGQYAGGGMVERTVKLPGDRILYRWQVLPIEDVQVAGWFDPQNIFRALPAWVFGKFYDPDFPGWLEPGTARDAQGNTEAGSLCYVDFSIDKDKGIVVFNKPVFMWNTDTTALPATLSLLCAASVPRRVGRRLAPLPRHEPPAAADLRDRSADLEARRDHLQRDPEDRQYRHHHRDGHEPGRVRQRGQQRHCRGQLRLPAADARRRDGHGPASLRPRRRHHTSHLVGRPGRGHDAHRPQYRVAPGAPDLPRAPAERESGAQQPHGAAAHDPAAEAELMPDVPFNTAGRSMTSPTARERVQGRGNARLVPAFNTASTLAPPGACAAITGTDAQGVLQIGQPTQDGQSPVAFVFQAPIQPGGYGAVTQDYPCLAAYDGASGTPAVGATWGPAAGSWLLTNGKSGFQATSSDLNGKITVVGTGAGSGSSLTVEGIGNVPKIQNVTLIDIGVGVTLTTTGPGEAMLSRPVNGAVFYGSTTLTLGNGNYSIVWPSVDAFGIYNFACACRRRICSANSNYHGTGEPRWHLRDRPGRHMAYQPRDNVLALATIRRLDHSPGLHVGRIRHDRKSVGHNKNPHHRPVQPRGRVLGEPKPAEPADACHARQRLRQSRELANDSPAPVAFRLCLALAA